MFYFCSFFRKSMKFLSRYILSAVAAALVCATTVPAQQLPGLKRHGRYHAGTLRCGVPYTLGLSTVDKGLADFALLVDTDAVPDARALLESLPHFPDGRPMRFLTGHGSGLGPDGYISRLAGVTVFRFNGLRVSDAMARDSVLLLLTDLIYMTPGGNHAILAAGDIDPNSTRSTLENLSMLLPGTAPQSFRDSYQWQPTAETKFRRGPAHGAVASIELTYRMPRTPRERLNTVVPYLSKVYSHALGNILYRRIRTACLAEHIPYGTIGYRYRSSADSPDDELFTLRVTTDTARVDRMLDIVAGTLSAIDRDGVLTGEYADETGRIYHHSLRFGKRMPNRVLMDKLIAATLYGCDLASEVEVAKFLTTRSLRKEEESRLMSGYAAALLDSAANLSLTVTGSSDPDPLARFRQAWSRGGGYLYTYVSHKADTLNLGVEPVKTKLKKELPEPVSGGQLWRFANGMEVVFKQTDGDPGYFHFGWLLRGGYPLVTDLADGEGAFVGDMLRLGFVGPLTGLDFYNMLLANGIEMEPAVGLQDLRLTGHAPSAELELLIRSLLELAHHRKPDPNAFATYRANQALALAEADRTEAGMWELMWPADRYSSWKNIRNLTDGLPQKAEQYFAGRFSRCNDGVLVLVGDLHPEKTKKLLSRWLGAMPVSPQRTLPARVDSQPRSGVLTVTRREGVPGCHMLLRIPLLYTAKNVYALNLAYYYLEDCLNADLTEGGLRYTLDGTFSSFPQGMVHLMIHATPAEPSALPAGIASSDPMDAVHSLRRALQRAAATQVPQALLKAYKERLQGDLDDTIKTEESLIEMIFKRYGEGKDLLTTYKQRLGEVTPEDLTAILQALYKGARIEYVVK